MYKNYFPRKMFELFDKYYIIQLKSMSCISAQLYSLEILRKSSVYIKLNFQTMASVINIETVIWQRAFNPLNNMLWLTQPRRFVLVSLLSLLSSPSKNHIIILYIISYYHVISTVILQCYSYEPL